MLKPFLIVSAAILFVFLAAPVTEGISQETPCPRQHKSRETYSCDAGKG
jgi:hypothetical protein